MIQVIVLYDFEFNTNDAILISHNETTSNVSYDYIHTIITKLSTNDKIETNESIQDDIDKYQKKHKKYKCVLFDVHRQYANNSINHR